MPRKKKSAKEMTTEELARSVFPKKVVEKLKEIAHEKEEKGPNQPSQDKSST
jgi:hypothetical protein